MQKMIGSGPVNLIGHGAKECRRRTDRVYGER